MEEIIILVIGGRGGYKRFEGLPCDFKRDAFPLKARVLLCDFLRSYLGSTALDVPEADLFFQSLSLWLGALPNCYSPE